mgnify:CR=1 FL=1
MPVVLTTYPQGDRIVRCFKVEDDYPYFTHLTDYQTTQPMQYIAFMPKNALDFSRNEVGRFLKLVHNNIVEPVQCFVTTKEQVQADRHVNITYATLIRMAMSVTCSSKNFFRISPPPSRHSTHLPGCAVNTQRS